jgi:hypothetical protein
VTDGGSVRVEGLSRLSATLRRAKIDISDLKAATMKAAATVAQAAQASSPRRTGTLAGSVHGNRATARATVSSRLVYAGVIHWGWPAHNIEPQPFVSQAAQDTEPVWVAEYQRDVQHALDKVKGA